MAKYEFVNPYNFFPLTNQKKLEDSRGDKKFSGVIQYTLNTKTPLFIPNTSSDEALVDKKMFDPKSGKEIEHKSFDFFSYNDLSTETPANAKCCRPVIPGSEIRGMLRSYYEILTESCLSAYNENAVLSKRTDQVFEAGLLVRNSDNGYDLYKADDVLWRTKGENSKEDELDWKKWYYDRKCYIQETLLEGTKVYFNKVERFVKNERTGRENPCKSLARGLSLEYESGKFEGYIMKGEPGPVMEPPKKGDDQSAPPQKHCCHIFCRTQDNNALKKNISLDGLVKVLAAYQSNSEGAYTEYKKQLECFKNGDGDAFPVYYSSNPGMKDEYFLSPASKTREIYSHRMKDMVKTFSSCSDEKNLCQACALFGTLGEGFSVASRIRFSDLQTVEDSMEDWGNLYESPKTLYPLSSPKLSNMEFYVRRPNDSAVFWTYDYYVDQNGKVHPFLPEIAGRKFYWHQMGKLQAYTQDRTNQNMTIRPLKPGVTFSGQLFFHKITERELQQLIWLLNAGDTEDLQERKHGYKLGAARPLGLGSVAMAVDRVILRSVRLDQGAVCYDEKDYACNVDASGLFADDVVRDFRKITDFYALDGEKVCYPGQADGNGEGYKWFVDNHKSYDGGKKIRSLRDRRQMRFIQYMRPLEPGLKSVSYTGDSKNRKMHFSKTATYTAQVVAISRSGKSLKIIVEDTSGVIPIRTLKKRPELYTKNELLNVKYISEKKHDDGEITYNFSEV